MDKVEAIKILKDFHDESAVFSVRTALETLHPELKESENERIRKFLHHTFKVQYLAKDGLGKWHGEPVTNILAWIEKRGEQKPSMQNGIIINGVEYELIRDREADECERCALKDICSTGDDVLCTLIFGSYIAVSHRFEKKTK